MKVTKIEIFLLVGAIVLLILNIFLSYNLSRRVEILENVTKPKIMAEEEFCNKACSIYCLSYGCIPLESKVFENGKCYCKVRSEVVFGNRIYRITSWIDLGVVENVEEVLVVNASNK